MRVTVTNMTTQPPGLSRGFSESDGFNDVLVYFIVGVFFHFNGLEIARQGVGLVGICNAHARCIVYGE